VPLATTIYLNKGCGIKSRERKSRGGSLLAEGLLHKITDLLVGDAVSREVVRTSRSFFSLPLKAYWVETFSLSGPR